jgi:hypothetical protein
LHNGFEGRVALVTVGRASTGDCETLAKRGAELGMDQKKNWQTDRQEVQMKLKTHLISVNVANPGSVNAMVEKLYQNLVTLIS